MTRDNGAKGFGMGQSHELREDGSQPMNTTNTWDAGLYDDKIAFVSKLGQGVVEWLNPQPGEHILDVGCGTGDLAAQIHAAGADVHGIDFSEAMIETAQQKYPVVSFQVADARTWRAEHPFDAVFSNAALHWICQPEAVISAIHANLKRGGRFAAEFGGQHNMTGVIDAISQVLGRRGVDATKRNPWYFPSIGEYARLLEADGFRVAQAVHFERPTPLPDGEQGLAHWLDMFADDFFLGFNHAEKSHLYDEIAEVAGPRLFRGGTWYADYWRLRVLAYRE